MSKNLRSGRAQLAAMRAILVPLGCSVEFKRASNHLIVEVRGPAGQRHCEPIGRNNHQDEALNMKRQDARRIARQWGLVPA